MPTLAVAVVESFLTMLDAEELSPLSLAAQIVELEFTAVSMVKMLESDAQVVCHFDKIAGIERYTFWDTMHKSGYIYLSMTWILIPLQRWHVGLKL